MIEDQPGWQAYHLLRSDVPPSPGTKTRWLVRWSPLPASRQRHSISVTMRSTPSNMVLCVAGNVDLKRCVPWPGRSCPNRQSRPFLGTAGQNPAPSSGKRTADHGSFCPAAPDGHQRNRSKDGPARLRQRFLGELACEALAGSSSPLYQRLYEEGLINSGFYLGYMDYPGCAFLMAGGESKDPEAVRDAILAEGARIAREGLDEGLVPAAEEGVVWRLCSGPQLLANLCVEQAKGYFAGQDPWTFPAIYEAMEKQDVKRSWPIG